MTTTDIATTFTATCHCGALEEYVDGKRVDGRCEHRRGELPTPPAPKLTILTTPHTSSGFTVVVEGEDHAPCGCLKLHHGAWLEHLVCRNGHPIPPPPDAP